MATRRDVLRWAGVVPAAGLLGGCGRRPVTDAHESKPPPVGSRLLVDVGPQPSLVDVRNGGVLPAVGVDGARWDDKVFARVLAGTGPGSGAAALTRISVLDLGWDERFATTVDGFLIPRAVSSSGDLVALTPVSGEGATIYRPAGRENTTIVVADRSGERHRFTLPGCLEPEAFSATGDALFVLDYEPPTAPEQYRVRVLQLATGEVQPLYTRDKQLIQPGAEERMGGQGRQAVYSPGQQYLYTLYTHQPDHLHTRDLIAGARDNAPDVHAFVHTLSLNQYFAYCIDLPTPFGEGPPETQAIAISPRGQQPIVVDAGAGVIARLDGVGLTVALTGLFPVGSGATYAAVAPDDGLCFVGTGTAVHVYRTATMSPAMTWAVDEPVRGLALSPSGDRLWVGQSDSVVALDTGNGGKVAGVSVPGLTAVRDVI